MTPLCALRNYLVRFPQLKAMSTQAGLARCLGKSESLVRAVESGRVPMSENFARQLAALFQVPQEWLMKKELSADEETPPYYNARTGEFYSFPLPNEYDLIAWRERLEDWLRKIESPKDKSFPNPPPRRDPPPLLDPPSHPDPGTGRYLMLRGKMIQNVLTGIHDHLASCPDEELRECLNELSEWTYSRLEKMAGDDAKGRGRRSKKESGKGH